MKTIRLFLIAFSLVSPFAKAQDASLENTNQALMYLNPSFAGSNGGIRWQNYYRNQWPNITGNFVTIQSAIDGFIKPINGGLALSIFSDDMARGTLKTNKASISYAQYFTLMDGNLKVIPSVQFTYIQIKLDVASLGFGGMINPRSGIVWNVRNIIPNPQKNNFDISTGLLLNYKNTYAGLSVMHLTQPDLGLMGTDKLPLRLNVHASGNRKLGDKALMQVFAMYSNQKQLNYLQVNANFILKNHLIIGAGILSNDGAMINVGYRNNYFSVQAGNNLTLSKLAGNTASIWSAMASFALRKKDQMSGLKNFENW